jgi:thymidylate kinase
MMERVQKRVMDKLFDDETTPQTKRVVAKVHTQLANKDATFMIVVDRYQDIKSSQEISTTCIDLQRALG